MGGGSPLFDVNKTKNRKTDMKMKRKSIYKQIALSLLLLVCAAGNNLAWGQNYVTGDKYLEPNAYNLSKAIISADLEGQDGHGIEMAFDNDKETWWAASTPGTATVTIEFDRKVTIQGMNILRSGNPNERATEIGIFTSETGETNSWKPAHTVSDINTTGSGNVPLLINFEDEITTQYLQIKFSREDNDSFYSAFNEIDFIIASMGELPTIQH